MSKQFDIDSAKVVAAVLKMVEDSEAHVLIKTTKRAEEVLVLQIPDFMQKSNDFQRTLLDLDVLPSRVFANNKNHRNSKKNCRSYIVYITNNKISSLSMKELKALLNSLDQNSKNISDVAPFIYNLFLNWNQMTRNLRTHRELTEDMVRGYLKALKNYSHREILDMVLDYGRWADAHFAMIEAGEFKPVWFPRLSLSGLLLSNKMFQNHLEGGWKQIVKDKGIPEDYVEMEPESNIVETPEDLKEKHDKRVRYIADEILKYGEPGLPQQQYYNKHKAEVDAKVEELRNAS